MEVKFGSSGFPEILSLYDSFGQTTTIVFTRFASAQPESSRFQFKVPQGVEVLETP